MLIHHQSKGRFRQKAAVLDHAQYRRGICAPCISRLIEIHFRAESRARGLKKAADCSWRSAGTCDQTCD